MRRRDAGQANAGSGRKRRSRRRTRRWVAIGASLFAVSLLLTVGYSLWRHRMTLFVLPPLWREVRLAAELDSSEPVKGGDDDDPRWSRLEQALWRVIELQWDKLGPRADDTGALCWFQSFHGLDGDAYYLACFSFEEVVAAPWPTEKPRHFSSRHWFLDDRGHVLPLSTNLGPEDPESSFVFGCNGTNDHRGGSFPDVLGDGVGSSSWIGGGCSTLALSSYGRLLTLDEAGAVSLGSVHDEAYSTPVSTSASDDDLPASPAETRKVSEWFGTGRLGDLHRALTLLEGRRSGHLVEHLLQHANAGIRARALAYLSQEIGWDRTVAFLDDTSPWVRRTAFSELRHFDLYDDRAAFLDALRRAARDPDSALRGRAAEWLMRHGDVEEARASLLVLYETRSSAEWLDVDFPRLSSPQVAEATVRYLEGLLRDFPDIAADAAGGLLEWKLAELQPAHLEPLVPRLITLANAVTRDSRQGVLLAFASLSTPAAQDFLFGVLADARLWPSEWYDPGSAPDEPGAHIVRILMALADVPMPEERVRQERLAVLRSVLDRFGSGPAALSAAVAIDVWERSGATPGLSDSTSVTRLVEQLFGVYDFGVLERAIARVGRAELFAELIARVLARRVPDLEDFEEGIPSVLPLVMLRLLRGDVPFSDARNELVERLVEHFPYTYSTVLGRLYLHQVGRLSDAELMVSLRDASGEDLESFEAWAWMGLFSPPHPQLRKPLLDFFEVMLRQPPFEPGVVVDVAGDENVGNFGEEDLDAELAAEELLATQRAYASEICRGLVLACLAHWPNEPSRKAVSLVRRATGRENDLQTSFLAHLVLAYWSEPEADESLRRFCSQAE